MVNWFLRGLFIFMLGACSRAETPVQKQLADKQPDIKSQSPVVLVLGIAQDAGYPQANCEKEQCKKYWQGEEHARYVSSIALVDPLSQSAWLFDATPDFKHQLKMLKIQYPESTLRGIFLTHAHIGHYTGLMQLGHEVMGASDVPVYAMPKMTTFLQTNGPWSQLVHYGNISLQPLHADQAINLTPEISVTPFVVPHRDEYSETVGYKIQSSDSSLLYIPDINKWEVWNRSIENEIRKVHFALLDGTFYDANELPGRNMTEIPHPFIQESLDRFSSLPLSEKKKIMFIHFNHTNPLILDSPEREYVEKLGYRVAKEGDKIKL
ncbi:MAG: pyrroloquinoline quinone biosynthesis protein PqqB [Crocinitomicaceae bacterium]|nr:pyrroloquinoline quinone biosynthesis protein PqqB [Crocinitomicaceae bacterium]